MKNFFQLRESLLSEKTMELAGETFQNMEHCPGAVAAFKKNLKDGASKEDVIKAARAVDAYLAIEDKAKKSGATAADVKKMKALIANAKSVISAAGLEGHTYHDMHLDRVQDMVNEAVKSADKKPEKYVDPEGNTRTRMVPVDREVVKEKTLTPAEKKKREEIAKAIERENPNMPMDKKMAIATAQAKKVAESYEDDMPASPDEKSMAMRQAKFITYVGEEIMEHLEQDNDFPEWMQNKLSAFHQKAKDMHATMAGEYEDDEDEDMNEQAKPDAAEVLRRRQQMKNISTSDKDKLSKMRQMLDKEKKPVNEISDKMKQRYINKAMGDHQHANAVRKDAESRGDKDTAAKMRDRMKKRNQGMTRAFGEERD